MDTHIQPERSDYGFLQLIQAVVYPLPPFPLDEWFPHLWGRKIITMVITQRKRRAEAWSKNAIRYSNVSNRHLSLFFGIGMFSWVVRHGWSSHVSNRSSVRSCVLFSGTQRAFRALGAAQLPYLSAAISMWMLQLFGCGIFPHTGSYQSRLTGHCLHSTTRTPGPGPGKKSGGDRCPGWHRRAAHSTQFPLVPGIRNTWLFYMYQWQLFSETLLQNYLWFFYIEQNRIIISEMLSSLKKMALMMADEADDAQILAMC